MEELPQPQAERVLEGEAFLEMGEVQTSHFFQLMVAEEEEDSNLMGPLGVVLARPQTEEVLVGVAQLQMRMEELAAVVAVVALTMTQLVAPEGMEGQQEQMEASAREVQQEEQALQILVVVEAEAEVLPIQLLGQAAMVEMGLMDQEEVALGSLLIRLHWTE